MSLKRETFQLSTSIAFPIGVFILVLILTGAAHFFQKQHTLYSANANTTLPTAAAKALNTHTSTISLPDTITR
jgi:hypothetical protein